MADSVSPADHKVPWPSDFDADDVTRSPQPPPAPITSALPSTGARLAAFAAIVVSGICGGLIGWKVADLSIAGDPGIIVGLAGLAGAVIGAGGVGVVAILVLRAMGEWQTIVETGDPTAARRSRRPS